MVKNLDTKLYCIWAR